MTMSNRSDSGRAFAHLRPAVAGAGAALAVTSAMPSRSGIGLIGSDPITVLIAEGVALYAGAMRTMLGNERDMDVLAVVLSDADLAATVARTKPDIALVDLDAPGRDGIAVCEALAATTAATRAILISAGPMPDALAKALASRAPGLINKHSGTGLLLDCIRRVADGHRFVDPRFRSVGTPVGANLTLREISLLRQSASGMSIRELAEELSLSQGTVRNYLSRILGKLGARNRIEAIRIAREAGWM